MNWKETDFHLSPINFFSLPKFLPHRNCIFLVSNFAPYSKINESYLKNRLSYEAEIFRIVFSYQKGHLVKISAKSETSRNHTLKTLRKNGSSTFVSCDKYPKGTLILSLEKFCPTEVKWRFSVVSPPQIRFFKGEIHFYQIVSR